MDNHELPSKKHTTLDIVPITELTELFGQLFQYLIPMGFARRRILPRTNRQEKGRMVVEDTPVFDWKFALGIAAALDDFMALMWRILGPSLQTHGICLRRDENARRPSDAGAGTGKGPIEGGKPLS